MRATIVLLLVGFLLPSQPASAQTTASAPTFPAPAAAEAARPSWQLGRPLAILAVGLAATSLTWNEAEPNGMQDGIADAGLDGFGDLGNTWGSSLVIGGASAGVLTAGLLGGDRATRDLGVDLCLSFASSALISGVIKHGVNRQRPDGGDLSFPSGHTTAAFSVVPVLGHHLGWRWGLAAGVLATGTGLGRMEARRHHLSDVLLGAAIGLAMGDLVVQRREHVDWLRGLAVAPDQVSYTLRF